MDCGSYKVSKCLNRIKNLGKRTAVTHKPSSLYEVKIKQSIHKFRQRRDTE